MKNKFFYIIILLSITFIIYPAIKKKLELKNKKEEINALSEKNKKEGKLFLAENKYKEGVVELESSLQYKIIKEGEGKSLKETDTVTVNYRGTLIDGKEF